MRNKEVLEAMLKNAGTNPQAKNPQGSMQTGMQGGMTGGQFAKESAERSGSQPVTTMGSHSHTFVPKADKFRTVPCKYYHRYSFSKVVRKVAVK
jgi:hypothetical protein